MPTAFSRILSFEQMVIEADPTYMLDRVQPEEYYFSNGRTFWHKLPYYDVPVNNIAQGLALVYGVIVATVEAVGSATGDSSATAIPFSFVNHYLVGSATGTSSADAHSGYGFGSAGHATGHGTAAAYPAGATPTVGTATGSSSANAVTNATFTYEGIGFAEGDSICVGISSIGGGLFIIDQLPNDILDSNVLGLNPILTLNHPVDGLLDVDVLGGIADGSAQAATTGTALGGSQAVARSNARVTTIGSATGTCISPGFTGEGNRGPGTASGSGSAHAVGAAQARTIGSATGTAYDPGAGTTQHLDTPANIHTTTITSATITLVWDVVAGNNISYVAAIGLFATGNFTETATATNSVTFSGLSAAHQYSMYVYATNGTLYSPTSGLVNATTTATSFPPLTLPTTSGAVSPMGWSVTFFDDFTALTNNVAGATCTTGALYNGSPAVYSTNPGGGSGLQGYSNPANLSQSGSVLNLNLTATAYNGLPYSGAGIYSNRFLNEKYGYWECRTKMPVGANGSANGLWGTFWVSNTNGWPQEMDIIEQNVSAGANHGGMSSTLHYGSNDGTINSVAGGSFQGMQLPNSGDPTTAFHTYGGLVTPDYIAFYCDGQLMSSTATPSGYAVAINGVNSFSGLNPDLPGYFGNSVMNFIIQLEVGSGESGTSVTSSTPPCAQQVDWVRYSAYPTSSLMRAADFIATMGVNVHISQGTASYSSSASVISDLQYLGVWNVRDSCNIGRQSTYTAVASAGAKFCFIGAVGGAWDASWVTQFLSYVTTVQNATPGCVLAVEGPNEINNFLGSWTPNGDTGINAGVDFQKALYSQAKALSYNPLVFYLTGYNAGGIGVGPNPATTPGLADYDTQHPYPNDAAPPLGWVNRTAALGNENPPTGPAVYTETGYRTPATSAAAKASYTLDLLMDAAKLGIYRTYIYQLMDEGDGFGLFDTNNNATPAATAIHNLTTILADTASNAASFSLSTVAYALSNLPSNGYSIAFQKANGDTYVAVWIEATSVPGPSTAVTVTFASTYPSLKVYDPILGPSAIQTLSSANAATIQVTDHPILVSTVTTPTPTPTPTVTPLWDAQIGNVTAWMTHGSHQGSDPFAYGFKGGGGGGFSESHGYWSDPPEDGTPQTCQMSGSDLRLGCIANTGGFINMNNGSAVCVSTILVNFDFTGGAFFQYGYHEFALRLTNNRGFMFHFDIEDYNPWQEIDLDVWIDTGGTHHIVARDASAGVTFANITNIDVTVKHIYGLDWQSGWLRFYVDGVLKGSTNNNYNRPFGSYMLVDTASYDPAGDGEIQSLPAYAYVSYYRIYTTKP